MFDVFECFMYGYYVSFRQVIFQNHTRTQTNYFLRAEPVYLYIFKLSNRYRLSNNEYDYQDKN